MMDLVTAFYTLARCVGDLAVDRPRGEAAQVLIDEMGRLAAAALREHSATREEQEDVVQMALLSLARNGPRREDDPRWRVEAVRGYLRIALVNNLRTLRRKQPLSLDAIIEGGGMEPPAAEAPVVQDRTVSREELGRIQNEVASRVLPSLHPSAKEGFQRGIDHKIRIYLGDTTKDELIRLCEPGPLSDAERRKAANRIEKECSRAVQKLAEGGRLLHRDGQIPTELWDLLVKALREFQRPKPPAAGGISGGVST